MVLNIEKCHFILVENKSSWADKIAHNRIESTGSNDEKILNVMRNTKLNSDATVSLCAGRRVKNAFARINNYL